MTPKEKFNYWAKIATFVVFGIIALAAEIYSFIVLPFNLLTFVYFFGMAIAIGFCVWVVVMLTKEYNTKKKKE